MEDLAMRKVVVCFTILSAITGLSAATAQTCGGNLACNTPSDAFLFSNLNGNGVAGWQGGPCTVASGVPLPAGVLGASAGNDGVVGYTNLGEAGVAGYHLNSQVCPAFVAVAGLLGVKRGGLLYGVFSVGNFGGTGAKFFVEPHPTDPSKEIRYVSLEGPEAGTYFRGTGRTRNGFATIQVPESFRMVTDTRGLTVVVTPVGELAQIAAISKSLDKIVIQSSKDVTFDYMVNGVRKAFNDFKSISENEDFVPQGPDDNRFFSYPAESQRRLVATGIYTPDGKVNLEKAREMGWDRLWAQREAEAQALSPQHR
jgi:hypothetical protein